VLGLALAVWVWATRKPEEPTTDQDPFPLSPLASSPFLNTGPGARYVGSAACTSCHQDRHDSFCSTGMGRSMAAVDATREPPDATFEHPLSKRRYQVLRKGGTLWHREFLLTDASQEVLLAEYPLKYVVGSGRHARTYLVEVDGFTVESPVTWYPSREAWDMSPGYDNANQWGFARQIGEGCLYCHAGQAEVVGQTVHKMRITEPVIGCERCHGPGSLHVALRSDPHKSGGPAGGIDYTIVKPTHLSRELSEAICQQCHLNAVAIVTNRGRKLTDYRPGLLLQDYFQVYTEQGPSQSMTVVGHVEQMHLSRCYQRSKQFSCLTCHDPHAEPAPENRTAYYNAICTQCHEPQRCKVEPVRRAKESPDNNCIYCHMPRSKTDIPHLSFTHHRVGVHDRAVAEGGPPNHQPELRPFLPFGNLSEIDRKLSLGEAYRSAALAEKDAVRATHFRARALEILTGVHDAGLRDPNLDAGLTQLSADMGVGDPFALAESALARLDLAGQNRCLALLGRARMYAAKKDFAGAASAMREVTQLRRLANDWLQLATYAHAAGDEPAAVEALLTAVHINPRLWTVHRHLAEHFREKGDLEKAAYHQLRAVP
jgi:predicted CXXCH cytochrome family protein